MKGLILVCLLATLCNAYVERTEEDEALKILGRAHNEVQISIENIDQTKVALFQILIDQIDQNYEEDALNIQRFRENRINRINEKLEEVKKYGNANNHIEHCLERIAMDIRNISFDTFHNVGQCHSAAEQQWNEIRELYERVIAAGRNLLNEMEINHMCHKPNSTATATCIVDRVMADISAYKKDVFNMFRQAEHMKSTISKQKLCNNDLVLKMRSAAKNWYASIEDCI